MNQSIKKIACVGEVMFEIFAGGNASGGFDQAKLGFAGDVFNLAVYLKREAPQMNVSVVTKLGNDALSDKLIGQMLSHKLDVSNIGRDAERTLGAYLIEVDPNGERHFSYWRSNSAARKMFNDGFSALEGFDVVVLSAITLAILSDSHREALLQYLDKSDVKIVFDSNYRPRLWQSQTQARYWIERAWEICDIGLPSIDDEFAVFEDFSEADLLKRFSTYSHDVTVLKRASKGPVAIYQGDVVELPSRAAVVPIDTTAAGDSFAGAFLANWLSGRKLLDAMERGQVIAEKVIQKQGAIVDT